ncbi:MAG: GreA/GreB family elongation factor [Myxococcales bacterium]|nr:GreA/GreB family elongation factor [Myxococcales bacterium]
MKHELHERIRSSLDDKRRILERATSAAHHAATDDESTAENKYDTRGLEAAYLAGAQSKRLAQLDQEIRILTRFAPRAFGADEPIGLGALVELASDEGSRIVFIAPCAGGLELELAHSRVSVVTPQSPLGGQLIGAYQGDEITLSLGARRVVYEILSVT